MEAAIMTNKENKNIGLLARYCCFLPIFLAIFSLFLAPFALPSSEIAVKNSLSKSLVLVHPKPAKVPLQSVTEETLNVLVKQGYFLLADLNSFLPASGYYFSSLERPLFLDEAFSHEYLNLENLSSKNHPPTLPV